MTDEDRRRLIYACYADFLKADPRRRGDALELGADWQQAGVRHRACWYEQTGELTLERLSPAEPLEAEDFHTGVSGPVEILRRIPTRAELSRLLGSWPNIAPREPRTVARLRELLTARACDEPLKAGSDARRG